jgi:hypothetical protein
MQRWAGVGFTSVQAELLAELVTRDYLDMRLREEFQRFKRSMVLWIVVMLAPVYATLIYVVMRLGM